MSPDDFDRDVYCLMGLPLDAVDMAQAIERVRLAARQGSPCFLSTPNLNFLIGSLSDPPFRDSVINSDLSIADGLPLVVMARWLGIPLPERVAGSGLFEALSQTPCDDQARLSVYFFGGHEGVAERACHALNNTAQGMRCVGFQSPGFGTVEAMSGEDTIARINASGADFLVLSLGARKGQAWIAHNRPRLDVPLISHLGAVVNFAAGAVRRAPRWSQMAGLEWLWRIKEEPSLWKRYWHDGIDLLGLVFTRLLPYALWLRLRKPATRAERPTQPLLLTMEHQACHMRLQGDIADPVPEAVRQALREAAAWKLDVEIDCSRAGYLSPGFFGLLLMLRKHLAPGGHALEFTFVAPRLRRQFRWNGVDYLLAGRRPMLCGTPSLEQA